MRIRIAHLALLLAVAGCMGMGGMGGRGGGMGRGRGGGGGGLPRGPGGGGGGGGGNVAPPSFPASSELQRFNPATLLIDRKDELALADTQVGTLVSLRKRMFDRNISAFARYDSLQRAYRAGSRDDYGYGRGRSRNPDQVEQSDSAFTVLQRLRAAVDTLNAHRLLDETDALAVVTDDAHRSRAATLLAQQDRDFRALLTPGLGGRGRGRGE